MTFPTPFGRYLLLEKLATGGMAEIFKAKLVGVEGFEKTLVIKRILPVWSERRDFITMLVDEAKVLVHLNHPNIVQVYELGRVGPTYFIAMEYVEGVDLKNLLSKAGTVGLPQEVAITIVVEALHGLFYAHERTLGPQGHLGIVHRDISPQNILLSLAGEVKVTDFGIAKAVTQTHETQTGVLKGKYAYMSPEQALGQALDYRSDLFSMGIVLWELLFQKRLFARKNDIQTLEAVRKAEVPWPEVPDRPILPGLRKVVDKSLALKAKDRFQSAEEFAEALEDCLPRGRKISQRKLAKSFQTILGENFKKKDQWEEKARATVAESPQSRRTQVAAATGEETVSLVEAPTEFDPVLREAGDRQSASLRMEAPKSKRARALPFILGALWIALAIGLAYIVVEQFQKEEVPVAISPPTQEETPRTPAQPETQPEPAPALGSLTFKVTPPQASLRAQYGDREVTGTGELLMKEIPEGTEVSLFASLKGYHEASQKIKISSPDLNVNKSITLQKKSPQFGSLTVGAHPYGIVTVPGYVTGRSTPVSISRIKVGTYSVKVSSGSRDKSISGRARIRPGRKTNCRALWDRGFVSCN